MGSKGLVGAVRIEINTQSFDIRNGVWRIGHTVGDHDCTNLSSDFTHLRDVIVGAHEVRTQRKTHQLGLVRDEVIEIPDAQFTIGFPNPPFLYHHAIL